MIFENEIICFAKIDFEPRTIDDITYEAGEWGKKIFIDRNTGIADYHFKNYDYGQENHDGVFYKHQSIQFYSREYKCQKMKEKKKLF